MEGLCSHSHRWCVWWVPKPVRDAGVCRLQSAGEAQSGTVGYQTDTRHTRAALQGWDRSARGTGTDTCLPGTVSSYAEEIE